MIGVGADEDDVVARAGSEGFEGLQAAVIQRPLRTRPLPEAWESGGRGDAPDGDAAPVSRCGRCVWGSWQGRFEGQAVTVPPARRQALAEAAEDLRTHHSSGKW